MRMIQANVEERKKRILKKLDSIVVHKKLITSFLAKSFVVTLFSQCSILTLAFYVDTSKKAITEPVSVLESSSESKEVKSQKISSPSKRYSANEMMNDNEFMKYLFLRKVFIMVFIVDGDKSEYKSDIQKVSRSYRQYLECLSSIQKDYKVILENVNKLVSLQ